MLDRTSTLDSTQSLPQRQRSPLEIKCAWFDQTICHHKLTAAAQTILWRLLYAHRNNKTGRCDPGKTTLAKDTGLAECTVKRALRGLEGRGLIIPERRKRAANLHATNSYTFSGLAEMLITPPEGVGSRMTLGRVTDDPRGRVTDDPQTLESKPKKEPESARARERLSFDDLPPGETERIRTATGYGDARLRELFDDCREWCGENHVRFGPYRFRKWCEDQPQRDREKAARAARAVNSGRPRSAMESVIAAGIAYVNGGRQ